MKFDTVEEALSEFRRGRPVVVVDDESRENEGDLIQAAEHVTDVDVAFFLTHTSGLLCTSIDHERSEHLALPLMVERNTEAQGTAFLVSVDLAEGTTTGISASDRAATIRALADPTMRPSDFSRPGHIFPLLARPGGVIERPGHTEAGIDLCRLAGLRPAALLCELVSSDRRDMLRGPALLDFARTHHLRVISIESLVAYRSRHLAPLIRVGEATIPRGSARFRGICYRDLTSGVEHIAMVLGDASAGQPLVRVHSECLTGDVLGSRRCDCGDQLSAALDRITQEGAGILIYLCGHEGRGIGLGHKIQAYALQEEIGLDTVDANLRLGLPVDTRDYSRGAEILHDLDATRIRLITNNPSKCQALAEHGITITERVGIHTFANPANIAYLQTKRDRMGHLLDLDASTEPPMSAPRDRSAQVQFAVER